MARPSLPQGKRSRATLNTARKHALADNAPNHDLYQPALTLTYRHSVSVMARLVRANYSRTLPRQVARTSRAMTMFGESRTQRRLVLHGAKGHSSACRPKGVNDKGDIKLKSVSRRLAGLAGVEFNGGVDDGPPHAISPISSFDIPFIIDKFSR